MKTSAKLPHLSPPFNYGMPSLLCLILSGFPHQQEYSRLMYDFLFLRNLELQVFKSLPVCPERRQWLSTAKVLPLVVIQIRSGHISIITYLLPERKIFLSEIQNFCLPYLTTDSFRLQSSFNKRCDCSQNNG